MPLFPPSFVCCAGATHLLFGDYPSLSALPYGHTVNAANDTILSAFAVDFRSALGAYVAEHACTMALLDTYALFQNIFAHPGSFGFDPHTTHDSCLTGAYGETPNVTVCDDPDRYVFW